MMMFTQVFKMAIKSIMSSKKRSLLTMLGIIIGVASVIALTGIASGATGDITKQLEDIGTNLISVSVSGRGDSNRKISLEEVQAFGEANKSIIDAVIPSISGNVTVKYGNENLTTTLEGTNEKYETVRNTKPTKGRFITAMDVEQRQNVALLGSYIAKELFPGGDGLGKEIKINGSIYYVVGIIEEKATSSAKSGDDKVYIPYSSAVRLMQNANLRSFSVQAKTPEATDAVMKKLETFLFDIFKDEDAYFILNQKEILKTLNNMTGMLTTMLAGIAGISLVVGGIGIMNIMLVAVTERTREIGVRKAIGASRGSIMTQFIIEAILISGLGGVIGIILGYGICAAAGKLMNMTTTPTINSVMLAFGFSVAVGVFFGWSPANKASKLKPIDALRAE
jgi:putative ABC transport system permease protein